MKILQLHNYYQQAGGEDVVVAAEQDLLQSHGHEVRLVSLSNADIGNLKQKINIFLHIAWSQESYNSVTRVIAEFNPDVVHVHNFFPLLTPSVFFACSAAGIPVVQTLHNFRLICPGAFLLRDGRICEDCIAGSPYNSVFHRCYRKSLLGTLAVARMIKYHHDCGTWINKVDRFIALTDFVKNKFVQAGFPEQKIVVKPNFVQYPTKTENIAERNGALYVGRLSDEKGIQTMLRAWRSLDVPLRIVGEGPLFDLVSNSSIKKITCLGRKLSSEVFEVMGKAAFLLMPSEWYETFGLVIIEAFACGLPVIASRLGSMAEIIQDGETGLLFRPGDAVDMACKVKWAAAHPEEMRKMGENARQVYMRKYTPEVNYRELLSIYEDVRRGKAPA